MKNCLKRVISLMLAVMLAVGTIPVAAMADYAQDSEIGNHARDAACGYHAGAPCGYHVGALCGKQVGGGGCNHSHF